MENNLAVYSSHLPLDAHPKLGNNAQLCAALGLKNLKPFFDSHGQKIGFQSRQKISRLELAKKLERATGTKPLLIPGGKEICAHIGVVTGGAGAELKQAAEDGQRPSQCCELTIRTFLNSSMQNDRKGYSLSLTSQWGSPAHSSMQLKRDETSILLSTERYTVPLKPGTSGIN